MKNLALIVLVLLAGFACKKKETKEDETPITPPTTNPAAPVFFINIPSDADGVLMATVTDHEFTNFYVTQLGKASAFFYTAPGNYNYVDAGVVKCNDSVLVKQSSGSYLYNGKPINGQPISGIQYGSGFVWNVSGNTNVPAFTFTSTTFPTNAALTSNTMIPKNNPYNVTFSGASNADSVVVMLSGDSTAIQKQTVGATSGICNFTSAQINAVRKQGSTSFPYISFISYKITANAVSTRKYYMVGSISSSYRVNIQ